MLLFLHEPYADELFYSFCARYHMMSRNPSPKDTIQDLFGVKSACAIFDLPNRLNIFYSRLPDGSSLTPDRIIQDHTLFPLFRPFLLQERAYQIFESMKRSDQGGSIHYRIGLMASAIPSPLFLRFCPECIDYDEKTYGEPFWHRSHQVSGVYICHIHNIWLWESTIPITYGHDKHAFYELSIKPQGKSLVPHDNENSYSKYLFISKGVFWLLNNQVNPAGLDVIREKYLSYLQQNGLCSFSGRIKQKCFINEFISFYGPTFLQEINCEVNFSSDNWLSKMVRKPRVTTHPLHHLLLMGFLKITPEEFFNLESVKNNPFGKGAWPCLNPAATHYHKNVIKKVMITWDTKIKVPVGNFECSCGFAYSRRGPDKKPEDRYRIGRIKSFGPVWDKKLLYLTINENISLRELSNRLNVDPKTIKSQLKRLRVEVVSESSPFQNLNEDLKSKKRSEWLELLKQNTDKSKTDIRNSAKSLYTWLYRHDRIWLKKSLPLGMKTTTINERVNWDELDIKIVEKIKIAVFSIIHRTKPLRLTVNAIGKEARVQMLLQKHLDKLPKTKELLSSVTETVEEFQCIRVHHISKKLKENDEILRPWKIIRHAGLPNEISPIVLNEIEKIMVMERNLQ